MYVLCSTLYCKNYFVIDHVIHNMLISYIGQKSADSSAFKNFVFIIIIIIINLHCYDDAQSALSSVSSIQYIMRITPCM